MKKMKVGAFLILSLASLQANAELSPGKLTFNGTLFTGPNEITTVVNPSVTLDGVTYPIALTRAPYIGSLHAEEDSICNAYGLGKFSGMETQKPLPAVEQLIAIGPGGFSFASGSQACASISCYSR